MLYSSTRGNSPSVNFLEVLTSGVAPDGGLYIDRTQASTDILISNQQSKLIKFLKFIEISGNNSIKFKHPSISGNTNSFELDFGNDTGSALNLIINGLITSMDNDSTDQIVIESSTNYLKINN